VTDDELAVAIRAGERAGVAIDAKDRRRHFGARLADDEAPRRFTLVALTEPIVQSRRSPGTSFGNAAGGVKRFA
jgi:hypothetical protein